MGAPHKCPVCNGAGRFPTAMPFGPGGGSAIYADGAWWKSCHACAGSGVLWEPSPPVDPPPPAESGSGKGV